MTTKEIIKSQYLATLEMLNQAIIQCPENLWADSNSKNQFYQIAYHALFYTHLYLQPSEEDFTPWKTHYENAHRFSSPEPVSSDEVESGEPYQKDEILEYLNYCRQEIEDKVTGLNLEADSGFNWIPFNKQELQFYNIRHLQHHTGELCERLGTIAGIDIKWVGMIRSDE
jgi:hypothetical protein